MINTHWLPVTQVKRQHDRIEHKKLNKQWRPSKRINIRTGNSRHDSVGTVFHYSQQNRERKSDGYRRQCKVNIKSCRFGERDDVLHYRVIEQPVHVSLLRGAQARDWLCAATIQKYVPISR